MPRKQADLDADFDFGIFVDPSCLSASMEEEILEKKGEECVEGIKTVPERAEPMDIPEDEGTITGNILYNELVKYGLALRRLFDEWWSPYASYFTHEHTPRRHMWRERSQLGMDTDVSW
jgi:hypothetical protein